MTENHTFRTRLRCRRAWLAAAGLLLAAAPAWAGGRTERVSVGPGGAQGNSTSGFGAFAVSAAGRFVAFTSDASNLVAGDTNGALDVFVRDRKLGTTERVSVATAGTEANGGSGRLGVAISAAGRFVAFYSEATNLVPNDTNGGSDIFV